jgi:hypothetical protein
MVLRPCFPALASGSTFCGHLFVAIAEASATEEVSVICEHQLNTQVPKEVPQRPQSVGVEPSFAGLAVGSQLVSTQSSKKATLKPPHWVCLMPRPGSERTRHVGSRQTTTWSSRTMRHIMRQRAAEHGSRQALRAKIEVLPMSAESIPLEPVSS